MSSSVSANGSIRAWRKIRAAYAVLLPWPCWRCGQMIGPSDAWDLGHVEDRAAGGGDDRLAPEHQACSRSAGGRLAAKRRRKGGQVYPPPSRDW